MRQRPTLPGRLQPSTIGVLRLNFCVRNGNRWNPQAIATAMGEQDCGGRSVSVSCFHTLFSAESSSVLSDSSLSPGSLSLALQGAFLSCLPFFRPARFPFLHLSVLSGSPLFLFQGLAVFPSPSFEVSGLPCFSPVLFQVPAKLCTLTTVYEFEIIFHHFLLVLSNRLNQAIDLLVSSSCIHYCTSTDDLSTW